MNGRRLPWMLLGIAALLSGLCVGPWLWYLLLPRSLAAEARTAIHGSSTLPRLPVMGLGLITLGLLFLFLLLLVMSFLHRRRSNPQRVHRPSTNPFEWPR